MIKELMTFHHFGLATNNEPAARAFLKLAGYQIGEQIYDPLQGVNLKLCQDESKPCVELVYPAEKPGPLQSILKNNSNIYHLCFLVENVEQVLSKMRESEIRYMCVSKPKPAVLFGGRSVSFYNIKGYGLLEMIHND
jgi:hypothetical protein